MRVYLVAIALARLLVTGQAGASGSSIAIYDLASAQDADAAIAQAWSLYQGKPRFAVIDSAAVLDRDGWSRRSAAP
jgi:hypothetical protein